MQDDQVRNLPVLGRPKYEEQRLLLDKYTIVEGDRTRSVFNWLQCFTPSELEDEFARNGLRVIERWGDVTGAAYDPNGTEFAVVAARA
jgi:hypothetical protein